PMPTSNLTDEDRADLARFLREAIEADRFPFSPRVKQLKALLAKIDPRPLACGFRRKSPAIPG
ncbi:MAG: hypothetical protein WB611_27605, partial [Stellaceae bacterium]